MCVNDILYDKRYGNPSVEVLRKILKSKQEAEMLPKRTIRCPICGFKLEEVYGYGASYVQVKCRKCKFEQPLNLAYFRRMRGFKRYGSLIQRIDKKRFER